MRTAESGRDGAATLAGPVQLPGGAADVRQLDGSVIHQVQGGDWSPDLGLLSAICLPATDHSTSTFTPATFQANSTPCLIPSRLRQFSTRTRLFPTSLAGEWSLGEDPLADLLMTRWNYSLPTFGSSVPDPPAWRISDLSCS